MKEISENKEPNKEEIKELEITQNSNIDEPGKEINDKFKSSATNLDIKKITNDKDRMK